MEERKLCMGLNPQFGPALEDQITMLKQAGFQGFFVKWERGEDLTALCQKGKQEGMIFQSIHAPMGRVWELWEDLDTTQDAIDELIECLQVCHHFQVPVMVCHVFIGFEKHCPTAVGLENFGKLIQAAEQLQVKIAFENTEGQEYLEYLMGHFAASPWVGFCWDTGHEMCYNRSQDLLALFGDRLFATHINDNLGISDPAGKIFWTDDLHLLPFDGIGDWQDNAARIKRHRFQGPLTFELLKQSKTNRHENDVYSQMTADEYFAAAFERARRFADMVDRI